MSLTQSTNHLMTKSEDHESKVFYLQMKGDYNRFIEEIVHGDLKQKSSDATLDAYQKATEEAKYLPAFYYITLCIALKFSILL